MGATNHTSLNAPAARPSPTPISKSTRPGMVTSNGRGISYRSKSGRTLTFEFLTPSARSTEDPFNKLGPLTESSTPPGTSTSSATDNGNNRAAASTKPRSTLPAKAAAAAAVVSQAQLPHTAELVVRRGSDASTTTITSKKDDDEAPVNPGVLVGIYDTLSFWCMEAVEVAMWGPYDEAPRTPGPTVLGKAAAAAATAEAAKA